MSYVEWLKISIIVMQVLIEIIFFIIGISIFSFLNVVIYRLPRKIQFIGGKSMCTTCGHKLAARDLVPVFSWIRLKGKCRYCGASISPRYMIVELIGGISIVVNTLVFGIKPIAFIYFLISGLLTVVFFIVFDKIRHL